MKMRPEHEQMLQSLRSKLPAPIILVRAGNDEKSRLACSKIYAVLDQLESAGLVRCFGDIDPETEVKWTITQVGLDYLKAKETRS